MKPLSPVTSPVSAHEFNSIPALRGKAALVVAHPGHELRVYGWLRLARPTVFVLTDGSGRTGRSRLSATTKLGTEAGVAFGGIYGRFTDIDIYRAVLERDFQAFTNLVEELTRELVKDGFAYVVGDAIEGYNPAHDVCRIVINAAVELARRRHSHEIANFDFLVVGDPSTAGAADRTISLRLEENTHSQKLAAAFAYPELTRDVGHALGSFGAEAFQVEYLRPVDNSSFDAGHFDEPPFYEQYGERQVFEGYYKHVLRHRQHMVPLFEALDSYVEHRS
jgi:hypothetical protein